MKIALVVNQIGTDHESNFRNILRLIEEAASKGAELVIFPETSATGLLNNDDPAHDLPLGQPIPGNMTDKLSEVCKAHKIHLIFGLLEVDSGALFDTGVLINPKGSIQLKYRRRSSGWHGPDADPTIYQEGKGLGITQTEFGPLGILICGDLFDDKLIDDYRQGNLSFPVCIMLRCFEAGVKIDQARWDTDEEPFYAERAIPAGCRLLIVNLLEDATLTEEPLFGGAWAVSPDGQVFAKWPLGKEGILMVEI